MPPKGTKHSFASRQKMSESTLRHFAERQNGDGEKECTKCGHSKPLEDFPRRKYQLLDGTVRLTRQARCQACQTEYQGIWWARKEAEGVADELKQTYRSRRKRPPYKPRPARKAKKPKPKRVELPVGPIAEILERELEQNDQTRIAEATGISVTCLYTIRKRKKATVGLATVDAILTGLGLPEEMHFLYPEEAG